MQSLKAPSGQELTIHILRFQVARYLPRVALCPRRKGKGHLGELACSWADTPGLCISHQEGPPKMQSDGVYFTNYPESKEKVGGDQGQCCRKRVLCLYKWVPPPPLC